MKQRLMTFSRAYNLAMKKLLTRSVLTIAYLEVRLLELPICIYRYHRLGRQRTLLPGSCAILEKKNFC